MSLPWPPSNSRPDLTEDFKQRRLQALEEQKVRMKKFYDALKDGTFHSMIKEKQRRFQLTLQDDMDLEELMHYMEWERRLADEGKVLLSWVHGTAAAVKPERRADLEEEIRKDESHLRELKAVFADFDRTSKETRKRIQEEGKEVVMADLMERVRKAREEKAREAIVHEPGDDEGNMNQIRSEDGPEKAVADKGT